VTTTVRLAYVSVMCLTLLIFHSQYSIVARRGLEKLWPIGRDWPVDTF